MQVHIITLNQSADATLARILRIRNAGEGVQAKPRMNVHVPPFRARSLDHPVESNVPSTSRVPLSVFRSDSFATTVAGPQGHNALTQATQQGLPTHLGQGQVQQFSNAQMIAMGCSSNANGSLTVDTLRPGIVLNRFSYQT
jgi:hypothetical protein